MKQKGKTKMPRRNQQNDRISCQLFVLKNDNSPPPRSPHPTRCGLRFLLAKAKPMRSQIPSVTVNNTVQSTRAMVVAGLQFSWGYRAQAQQQDVCLLTRQEKQLSFPKFSIEKVLKPVACLQRCIFIFTVIERSDVFANVFVAL